MVDGFIFEEELIVFGNSDEEKNCGDIFEVVNLFFMFRLLVINIKYVVGEVVDNECGFGDISGFDM